MTKNQLTYGFSNWRCSERFPAAESPIRRSLLVVSAENDGVFKVCMPSGYWK